MKDLLDEIAKSGADGFFTGFKQKLAEAERTIAKTELSLAMASATQALWSNAIFQRLLKDCDGLVASETEKLISRRHSEYELGYRQGYIQALRELAKSKPMSEADRLALETSLTPLREEVTRLKNVLA